MKYKIIMSKIVVMVKKLFPKMKELKLKKMYKSFLFSLLKFKSSIIVYLSSNFLYCIVFFIDYKLYEKFISRFIIKALQRYIRILSIKKFKR